MTDLLSASGLRKRFGDFVAIDGIDLRLPARRLTSIIGPNGAGKTTLINLITGLLTPDAGTVLFDGEDVTKYPAHERVRRGMARSFQVSAVFPQLSVADNVLLPVLARRGEAARSFRPLASLPAAAEELDRLLAAVNLLPLRDELAGSLTHGSERLLEVAMALATRPRLCLLDEPCAGLSPSERRQMLELIHRLERETETTFVVVEHDMEVVFALSQWIVVLHRGTLLSEGPPDQIRSDPRVREIYLGEEVGRDAGTS